LEVSDMRGVILILAAAAAVSSLPAPASAERHGSRWSSHRSQPHVRVHRDGDRRAFPDFVSGERQRDRRARGDVFFPYRDYQGDSLWRSDSFNDWWHDRPDRAFPRWVANNRDCQRRYWAGGDWRC
jgi:hypothetical protein